MIEIRELQKEDIPNIVAAFAAIGLGKPVLQYQMYLAEQAQNRRRVLVAFQDEQFVGYLTIVWEPEYPPFRDANIPEIQDFNVLPEFRKRGIGTQLMEKAEEIVAQKSETVGVGVGLDADYGAAQRLYVLRGYVPDGNGISWHNRFPTYGEQVAVDDELTLHLTKKLKG